MRPLILWCRPYILALERMLLQLAVYTEMMPAPPTGRALLLGVRPLQCAEAGCTSPSAHKSVLRATERPHTARYPPCTSKAIPAARGGGLTPPAAERTGPSSPASSPPPPPPPSARV